MMESSDFITQFYNLEGDLIAERKKNFFKLLKVHSTPLNEEDLKDLRPRTYLESMFQVDIFIHFKIYSKLLNLIKEGNEAFISKILKHPTVLKEAVGYVSAEAFVNNFLPSTSYVMRLKILNKISLALNESEIDDIVFWVHKRYGLRIARTILHTCSSEKIKHYLSKYEIKFTPRQIRLIFEKDPELLLIYLIHYKTITGHLYEDKKLFRYVSFKNPEIFLKLKRENAMSVVCLGRRTTKNFLRQVDSDLHTNVKYYSDFLKIDIIARNLRGNFKEVYFELFPRDLKKLNTDNFEHKLLKYYPKKKQWDLFAETFSRVFRYQIVDNLIYLNSNYIQLFPNKTVLNNWAEAHYNKDKSDKTLQYCDPNKAIPWIKEKINVTSNVYKRKDLVNLLVENCARNEDLISLEAVLQYITVRHRDGEVAYDILESIESPRLSFKFEEFNENHWKYINEIVALLKTERGYHVKVRNSFFLKHLEYLILSGKSFRKELVRYTEDVVLNQQSRNTGYGYGVTELSMEDLKKPEVAKQIFIEVLNVFPEIMQCDEAIFKKHQENLIAKVISFNNEHPDHSIELSNFPHLFTYIKSICDKEEKLDIEERYILQKVITYNFNFPQKPIIKIEQDQLLVILRNDYNNNKNFYFGGIVSKIVKKLDRSKFENDVLQFFWDELVEEYWSTKTIIPWLFRHEPKSIMPHFDRILKGQGVKGIDMNYIKLMSHLGLDKKVKDHCINELKKCIEEYKKQVAQQNAATHENISNKTKEEIKFDLDEEIIYILCNLLSTKDYVEIVANEFLPIQEKRKKLDDFYAMQCTVAKSFKRMRDPADALPTLMKFCQGDYLRYALHALYSLCYRSPEHILYAYVEQLATRAVSVRKHAIFLSCQLLNVVYILGMLQNANKSNVSSQKHFFSALLKYFCNNPSEELLDMIIANFSNVDKNDEETFTSLLYANIPKKYMTLYIQKCWYFFEAQRSKEVGVENYLQLLLYKCMNYSTSLPDDFCRHIITEYFKDSPEKDYSIYNIPLFSCMTLLKETEQTQNFKLVFDIISSFKSKGKTTFIKDFFMVFYHEALKHVKDNNKIDRNNNYYIELFKNQWCNLFTPIQMFDEHILLHLLFLMCKSQENLIENYAREVVLFLEELVAEYGFLIYYKFKDLLLLKHSLTDKEKYLLFYSILKFKNSALNFILVIDVLVLYNSDEDCEIKDICNKVMEILKNSTDPMVSMYYNSKFAPKD